MWCLEVLQYLNQQAAEKALSDREQLDRFVNEGGPDEAEVPPQIESFEAFQRMQEFRPLEQAVRKDILRAHRYAFFNQEESSVNAEKKAVIETKERWNEYCAQCRSTPNWRSDPKASITHLLREHPFYDWRTIEVLVQDSGISMAFVVAAINQLMNEGIVVRRRINQGPVYALKARVEQTFIAEGDEADCPITQMLVKSEPTNTTVQPLKTSLDEMQKIINDACLKVREAAKLNERLISLEQDVTSKQESSLRQLEGTQPPWGFDV